MRNDKYSLIEKGKEFQKKSEKRNNSLRERKKGKRDRERDTAIFLLYV